MKQFFQLCLTLLVAGSFSAQVGINTENPKATLQIQKKSDLTFPDGLILPRISGDSLRLKDAAYGMDQHSVMLFVTSPTTNNTLKTWNVRSPGIYMYDGTFTHANNTKGMWMQMEDTNSVNSNDVYAVRASGSLTLLDLGLNLLGSAVYSLPIVNTSNTQFEVEIPSPQIANNSYVVPKNGVYSIDYSYRTGQGLRAELLSGNRPGIIITKTANGATDTLDYRMFGGVQLLDVGLFGLVNVSLTQGQISHIYNLEAGDILNFGVVKGGLSLGVLTDSSAELAIYKIR